MNIQIPKIPLKNLSKHELEIYNDLCVEHYGNTLAAKVSKKLIHSHSEINGIHFSHRDYCGLGIFYYQETFILGTVYDGYGPDTKIILFDSKNEFMNWLANENDQNMALYGKKFNNQTITKSRLEWFLEENYSSIWNNYCHYLATKRAEL